VHDRATRAQAEVIMQRPLLAMVTEVLPRLADGGGSGSGD
jgi:hypothetical protein